MAHEVEFLVTKMEVLNFGELKIEKIELYYIRDLLEFRPVPFYIFLDNHRVAVVEWFGLVFLDSLLGDAEEELSG